MVFFMHIGWVKHRAAVAPLLPRRLCTESVSNTQRRPRKGVNFTAPPRSHILASVAPCVGLAGALPLLLWRRSWRAPHGSAACRRGCNGVTRSDESHQLTHGQGHTNRLLQNRRWICPRQLGLSSPLRPARRALLQAAPSTWWSLHTARALLLWLRSMGWTCRRASSWRGTG